MQASAGEIAREMESIRSMRRISSQTGPGSLALDPDLPPSSATPTSPTNQALNDEDDTVIPQGSNSQYFWVPAGLHPELAPSEFKAFLRDHRRDVEEGSSTPGDLSVGLQRSGSSSSLGRKKSMLSRQYKPRSDSEEGDDADADNKEEEIKPKRSRMSTYERPQPSLTIADLQKLDQLADAAAKGERKETALLRSELRRSLSMGYSTSGTFTWQSLEKR